MVGQRLGAGAQRNEGLPLTVARQPAASGALGVDDELLGVDLLDEPRPVHAGQAPWGELNENNRGDSSVRAKPQRGQEWREESDELLAPAAGAIAHHALADLERGLERVGETVAEVVAHLKPIDDHLDGVLLLLVEVGRVGGVDQLAVDPGPHEPLRDHLLEQLAVLALAWRPSSGASTMKRAAGRQRRASGRPSAATVCGLGSAGRSRGSAARRSRRTAAAGSRRSR